MAGLACNLWVECATYARDRLFVERDRPEEHKSQEFLENYFKKTYERVSELAVTCPWDISIFYYPSYCKWSSTARATGVYILMTVIGR